MKLVLLTGMSGVGKSVVAGQLAARGYRAVDVDRPEWSQWASSDGDGPMSRRRGQDWVWREDRVRRLLATAEADVLFVSGCAANQGRFHEQFDHIVLLSAPADVMVERLANRDSNDHGEQQDEAARALRFKRTVEPRLRAAADVEVDTSGPLEQVVTAVLELVDA